MISDCDEIFSVCRAFNLKYLNKNKISKCFCFDWYMGVSMGSRQLHPATSSKFNETFRVCNRVLRDSPESRKIPFAPSRGTNGTVPKNFRDGTNGIGTIRKISGRDKRDSGLFKKTDVPKFLNSFRTRCKL